ncbi:MAG: hypothetical protein HY720_31485 [Planctomycetes bacterium]|nr:hypothetical protein [Planctomycetota bacterium]
MSDPSFDEALLGLLGRSESGNPPDAEELARVANELGLGSGPELGQLLELLRSLRGRPGPGPMPADVDRRLVSVLGGFLAGRDALPISMRSLRDLLLRALSDSDFRARLLVGREALTELGVDLGEKEYEILVGLLRPNLASPLRSQEDLEQRLAAIVLNFLSRS